MRLVRFGFQETLRRAIKELNPIAYYPLDDGGDGKAMNIAYGHEHSPDATVTGALVHQEGHVSKSMSLDGTNDIIISDSNLGISGNSPCSLLIMVNLPSDTTDDLISFGQGDSNGRPFRIRVDGNGNITAGSWGSEFTIESSTPVITDAWQMLLATYDTNQTRLYINGVESEDSPEEFTLNLQNAPLYIGGLNANSPSFAQGFFQHAAVFDYALSAEQALKLAQAAKLA